MEQQLTDVLAWLAPHALVLALALPPVIRCVGHLVPEELFMISMGVLAARAPSAGQAATLLGAVLLSQLLTDQTVYLVGCWLRPRLQRFPAIASRLERVTARLASSPAALLGLIPGRVLPLGRAAWLAGAGVVAIPWPRFALVDLLALVTHVAVWSGMGWWLAGDLLRLQTSAELGRVLGLWLAAALVGAIIAVLVWRRRPSWQPTTTRAMRKAAATVRRWGGE